VDACGWLFAVGEGAVGGDALAAYDGADGNEDRSVDL